MNVGRIVRLSVVGVGLSVAAVASAAEDSTLADAAETGRTTLVRTLLDSGADVNGTQVDGMTALHWAVYHDDSVTTSVLVKAGADVGAANRYGVTPISLAATNRNADVVRLLLDAGADANATLSGGETVLMTASRTGSVESVTALLSGGADPNAQEQRDQTALMWAAAEGHAPVVKALIHAGGDVHASLTSGFTPLFFAVRGGHLDAVRTLLEAGVDVNEVLQRVKEGSGAFLNSVSKRPVDDGMSPLLLAVRNGHFELAVALVAAGADPNDQRTGFNPLHTVTWVRKPDASDLGDPSPTGSGSLTSLDFVKNLVELGADVNAQLLGTKARPPHTASRIEMEGATALLMAADRADTALMRVLLDLGADPSLVNVKHTTPLMAAAGLGTGAPLEEAGTELEAIEAVQFLLEMGADIDAVDQDGNTAMHGAAFAHFPRVVELLAERGSDPAVWSVPNHGGLTPLFIAEGHRGGGFKPSRPTMDAVAALMLLEQLPMDGPRPTVRDIYEKPPKVVEPPKPPQPRP